MSGSGSATEQPDEQSVTGKLRAFRHAVGFSQAALGRTLGVHGSMVSKMEIGERAPSLVLADDYVRWAQGQGSLHGIEADQIPTMADLVLLARSHERQD